MSLMFFSQVEICLSEVLRSDIFIGIIGGRYGWIPSHFSVDILPDCGRLQGHFDGRSITELEMNLFALTRADDVTGKAFFYIRDQSFLRYVSLNLMILSAVLLLYIFNYFISFCVVLCCISI